MLPPAEVRLDQLSGVTASSDCEIYVRTLGNALLNKQKTHVRAKLVFEQCYYNHKVVYCLFPG